MTSDSWPLIPGASLIPLLSTLVAVLPLLAEDLHPAELPGITIDLQNRLLLLKAQIATRQGMLECVACSQGTKEHESLLVVEARPQHVHFGLLLLGLEPGRPLRWDEDGKAHPPQGPPVQLLVEYFQAEPSQHDREPDEEGEQQSSPTLLKHCHAVTDWIRDVETRKSVVQRNWVFAGSSVDRAGHYAADGDGAVISVVNFSSSIVDLPKIRSDANAELRWEAFTERMPEAQSPVTLIVKPVDVSEPVQLHMDKFGRLTLDRNRIMLGQLKNEMRQRGSGGLELQVIITVDAASLSFDLDRLVETLHAIGIHDDQITVQTESVQPKQSNMGNLPSPQDFAKVLTGQIARYQQMLGDARAQHQRVLQQLRAGADELAEKGQLLEAYWLWQQQEAERALQYLSDDRRRETVAR